MVLVQNKYKNTLVGVLRTQITFVTHSTPSCYVTLHSQVIRLNSGNLGPQKPTRVFLLLYTQLFHIYSPGGAAAEGDNQDVDATEQELRQLEEELIFPLRKVRFLLFCTQVCIMSKSIVTFRK